MNTLKTRDFRYILSVADFHYAITTRISGFKFCANWNSRNKSSSDNTSGHLKRCNWKQVVFFLVV